MTRVNEWSQFYLPPTRLSTSGMNHTCLYSPAAQHHRTLALVLISRPAEGRRLSWPGWLSEILRWFVPGRRSPIPVVTGPDVEKLRWYAQRRYCYTLRVIGRGKWAVGFRIAETTAWMNAVIFDVSLCVSRCCSHEHIRVRGSHSTISQWDTDSILLSFMLWD